MRRLAISTLGALLLMLFASMAAGGNAASAQIGALELSTITAGFCVQCAPEESPPPPPPPPTVVGYAWEVVSQKSTNPTQVSYALMQEFSNSTKSPQTIRQTYSDECRNMFTSGGVGISTGFNITVGTTYHCASQTTLEITVKPGERVKVYKAQMRYTTTYVVAEVQVMSDGTTRRTGRTDTGTKEHRYSKYSTVSGSVP